MRPLARIVIALIAAAGLAGGLASCGSGVSGDSVAEMAGNPISKQAFDHWIYVAAKGQSASSPGAPVIVPDPPEYKNCIAAARTITALAKVADKTLKNDCAQVFKQLDQQVMDFLIRSYWYQALAHDRNVKVSDADVQKAFRTAKGAQFPTDAQFQTFLRQSGQTLKDIMYRVRVNELYKKLIKTQRQQVTPKTIQAYYESHKQQFGTPEQRNIRIVLAKSQAQAQAAFNALSKGATWKATAAKYSTDPATKSKGGLLTAVTKGQEDAALDTAAFSAPAQKLSGPVKGQFGYYVFKVTSVKPGTTQTLAQATPLIRNILQQQGSTSAQAAIDQAAKKKYLSRTTCRSLYAMTACSGYKPPKISQRPVAPSPSSSSTATSTTGK